MMEKCCYITESQYYISRYLSIRYIILLAPCRSAMAQMVKICEDYGKKNNLMVSTDSNPAKSKTKVMSMWTNSEESTLPLSSSMVGLTPGITCNSLYSLGSTDDYSVY